ncbi:MAG TPA: transcription antitermination factor NusB [Armatimonadota bacterium]
MKKHQQRHLGRELALQWIFQIDVGGMKPEVAMQETARGIEGNEALDELNDEGIAYAQQLVRGVVDNRAEIDAVIVKFARGWKLDRIAAVERNVLRLAIYEILHQQDVPPSVTVDEAVEITKQYSTDESAKFVNGILGAYLRDEPEKPEKAKE